MAFSVDRAISESDATKVGSSVLVYKEKIEEC